MLGSRIIIKRGSKGRTREAVWISYADLMTALMVLFLVVMSVALLAVTKTVSEVTKTVSEIERRKAEREQDITKLLDEIEKAADRIPASRSTRSGISSISVTRPVSTKPKAR